MSILERVFDAQLSVFGQPILYRDLLGNLFGFASAIGGLKRRIWAWPIGIIGNALLFTVFFGVAFYTPQHVTLYGQAGRQIFFIITSVYGWYRWNENRKGRAAGAPVLTPRWASGRERLGYVLGWVLGVVVVQQVFFAIGAGFPAPRWYFWTDAWIFVGSIVATYAMARGWTDFWLAWIAVDVVGVPLLFNSHFYASGVLYIVYAALVVYGFTVWRRASRVELPTGQVASTVDA
jgi:nicotinamide mononucleotide transporter